MRLNFAYALLLCNLVLGVIYGQDIGKLSKDDFDIKISKDLKDDEQSSKEFNQLYEAFRKEEEEKLEKEEDISPQFRIEHFKKIKSLIQKHPSSKSALTAKLKIALLCINYPKNEWKLSMHSIGREMAQDIAKNYPKHWQGKYALFVMSLSYIWDFNLDEKERYKKALEILNDSINTFKELDEEKDGEFTVVNKEVTNAKWEKFSVWIQLNIASIYRHLSEIDKAKEIYKRVIKDYPNTTLSEEAKGSIDSIEYEEALKKKEEEDKSKK